MKREQTSPLRYCMVGLINYPADARVKGYATLLRNAGWQVDVLGLHQLDNGFIDESGVRLFSIPVSWTRKSRVRYMLEYGLSVVELGWLLTKLHFRNRYQVIHVHNMPDFLVFCALIPRFLGAKIVLDIHDPMPEVYASKFPGRKNSIMAQLLRLEERISTAFADTVITANFHFNRRLTERGVPEAKITTIQNYPDPIIFNASRRRERKIENHEYFTLIFPGTIAPRYGLEVAIQAIPLLIEKVPNIRLLIIGWQDEYSKALKLRTQQLGVAHFVDIRQTMPIQDIAGQLVQADVGIYPALPDCHMSMAIPGKVLEFAIMGLPILSSRLPIVEEIVGDSGALFFEPGNVEEFAQCVLQLHESPALRAKLVEEADRVFAEHQSREREIQAYWNLLSRLVPQYGRLINAQKLLP